jgi:hypothetical protein
MVSDFESTFDFAPFKFEGANLAQLGFPRQVGGPCVVAPVGLVRYARWRRILHRLLLVAGVYGCAALQDEPSAPKFADLASAIPSSASTARNPTSDDLTFLSTVTSIEAADTGNARKKWVVTTRVDKILSGDFAGTQFSFAIHSPAQSGLEVGKQYRIRATRTHKGYLVDEDQWRQSP